MRRWYIVQTYSGQENSVKEDLELQVKSRGFQDKIIQIIAPEETYEETKTDRQGNTKKVIKTRKLYPSYLFVEFEIESLEVGVDSEAWFMVRNTPGVTGFLGSSGRGTKPNPVRESEMNDILMRMGKMEKPEFACKIGDRVEIVAGPFAGQIGEVSNINESKETVTVMLPMFGRLAPNELDVKDVKKL
jgi:transcription termination/antitermination protein NusG